MNRIDGNPAYKEEPEKERVGGKPVMLAAPLLNHIFVSVNIFRIFDTYLRGKPCTVLPDGAALYLADGEEYRPDVMVVCDPEKLRKKGVYGAPDLVVEILSPGTARYDRGRKMSVYARSGVREYWIVDPVHCSVEQYVLENGAFVLRDVYTRYSREDWEDMEEAERAAVTEEFHCSLFDDLTISVQDIFYRVADR